MSAQVPPAPENALLPWSENFSTQLSATGGNYDFTDPEIQAIVVLINDWETAVETARSAADAARAANAAKADAREEMLASVRAAIRRLQAHKDMTDAMRQTYGITVPSDQHTPVPAPTSAPLGIVEMGERLQHVLKVVDSETPTSRAKPYGVIGAEVWMKIGPAPVGPSEMQMVAVHTNHQYVQEFADGDGGKQAHYMLRWVNTRGQKGPWSETLSATIAA